MLLVVKTAGVCVCGVWGVDWVGRGGGSKSSSIKPGYPANRQRSSPRGDMCNLILVFINKKRSYYVDWVSSGEHELSRCNLEKKEKKEKGGKSLWLHYWSSQWYI